MPKLLSVSRTHRHAVQIICGLALLFMGCVIYLLLRSETIALNRWGAAIGINTLIAPLRSAAQPLTIPDFVRYSLPDGLYCAAYILIMDAVWKGGKPSRVIASSLVPAIAVAHESLQGLGIVKGTFDTTDLLSYSLPLFIYLIIYACARKRNN